MGCHLGFEGLQVKFASSFFISGLQVRKRLLSSAAIKALNAHSCNYTVNGIRQMPPSSPATASSLSPSPWCLNAYYVAANVWYLASDPHPRISRQARSRPPGGPASSAAGRGQTYLQLTAKVPTFKTAKLVTVWPLLPSSDFASATWAQWRTICLHSVKMLNPAALRPHMPQLLVLKHPVLKSTKVNERLITIGQTTMQQARKGYARRQVTTRLQRGCLQIIAHPAIAVLDCSCCQHYGCFWEYSRG